jgi:hypothetical protein
VEVDEVNISKQQRGFGQAILAIVLKWDDRDGEGSAGCQPAALGSSPSAYRVDFPSRLPLAPT